MSGRQAKRARRQTPGSSIGLKAGGLLKTIVDAPDRCRTCGEPHHKPFFPWKPGGPAALGDSWVNDAVVHTTVATWQVLKEYGVPEDRWLEVLEPVATAIGTVAAAAEHHGRRGAIELFFQGLIEEQGYGTYVIELGPNGPVSVGRAS